VRHASAEAQSSNSAASEYKHRVQAPDSAHQRKHSRDAGGELTNCSAHQERGESASRRRNIASGLALVEWGLPVLSRAQAARGQGQRAARLTTWVTQVLCSAEPLTTTHGGSIVILSRENLRARTHHTHQPSPVIAHAGKATDDAHSKTRVRAAPAPPWTPHALRLAAIVSNERPPLKQPPCGAVHAGVCGGYIFVPILGTKLSFFF
jgi:hypothetical protein